MSDTSKHLVLGGVYEERCLLDLFPEKKYNYEIEEEGEKFGAISSFRTCKDNDLAARFIRIAENANGDIYRCFYIHKNLSAKGIFEL